VEWHQSVKDANINFEGVEYKAIACGSHAVTTDYVYVYAMLFYYSLIHYCDVCTDCVSWVTFHISLRLHARHARTHSYFKHKHLYGIACFNKVTTNNAKERFTRMRSVGVLSHAYTALHLHIPFLAKEARFECMCVCVCVYFLHVCAHHIMHVIY